MGSGSRGGHRKVSALSYVPRVAYAGRAMSDNNEPTDTPKPKQGRSLRAEQSGQVAAEPERAEEMPEHHGHVPPENPVDFLPPSETPMGRRLAEAVGPKVMVNNKMEGLRLAQANIPLLDEHGKLQHDGGGQVRYAEQPRVWLKPGINLVPLEQFKKIRPSMDEEVRLGEVEVLGDDPNAVQPRRLVPAIASTGADEVLLWIAQRTSNAEVLSAIEARKREIGRIEGPRRTG